MKKTYVVLLLSLLALISHNPLNASMATLDYTRIEKKDGIWYGIIEISDAYFYPPIKGDPFQKSQNLIALKFSRETERLTSITYSFTTAPICEGFGINVSFLCLGNFKESYEDNETVFFKESDGFWDIFRTNTNMITEYSGSDYDYAVYSKTTIPFKSIDVLSYTYILTDEEVDKVMLDIQDQYDRELTAILIDDSLTLSEKELAMRVLNREYRDYTIKYGEEIESLCLDEVLCHIEPERNESIVPAFSDYRSLIVGILIIIFIFVFISNFGLLILSEMGSVLLKFVLDFAKAVAEIVYFYIWKPFLSGLELIFKALSKLLFGATNE